jgi:photosystem II stability/assembly factor-like uncharacterized protein
MMAPTAQRSAADSMTPPTLSVSPANPLIRWRIVMSASIERSMDAGNTWARTTAAPPGQLTRIRAVDADRAVATTSDGSDYYTLNGGVSWIRVQEKSAAPF